MKQKVLTLLVSLMLVSVVFSGIGFAQETPTETPDAPTEAPDAPTNNTTDENETDSNATVNESSESPPPGLQISAMMGKMSKDIDATIERYSLGYQMRNAESQEEREQIINNFVDEEVNESEEAVANQNKASQGQSASSEGYTTAMNMVSARNSAENGEHAKKLAEEYNVSVNETKLNHLRNNAQNMSGQEVSSLARSLAGPPEGVGGGPPAWAGNDDDDVEVNETVASEKLTEAEASLADARNNSNVSNETVAEAESDLAEARSLFEKAQNLSAEEVENETDVENETEEVENETDVENETEEVENETDVENETEEVEDETEDVEDESEEADEESELEEERQDLYEEVYDLASDSIEELEEESTDSEADDERPGNAPDEDDGDERGPPANAGGK